VLPPAYQTIGAKCADPGPAGAAVFGCLEVSNQAPAQFFDHVYRNLIDGSRVISPALLFNLSDIWIESWEAICIRVMRGSEFSLYKPVTF